MRALVCGGIALGIVIGTGRAAADEPAESPATSESTGPTSPAPDDVFVLDPRGPEWAAFGLGLGGMAGLLTATAELDRRMARAGRDPLPAAGGALTLELHGEVRRVVLQLDGFMFLAGSRAEMVGGSLSAGYRIASRGAWSVTPLLGVGLVGFQTCLDGDPSQQARPDRDPFDQVLAAPGPRACLSSLSTVGRAGLAIDHHTRYRTQDGLMAGWYVGARLQGLLPLATGDWSMKSSQGGLLTQPRFELPSFAGPLAPTMGVGIGIVAGVELGE